MKTVWIIEGWFGDIEWIESVWANEADAEAEVNRLMKARRSVMLLDDHFAQGLCKFTAVEHAVQTSNQEKEEA
jgi:hypothetical protein